VAPSLYQSNRPTMISKKTSIAMSLITLLAIVGALAFYRASSAPKTDGSRTETIDVLGFAMSGLEKFAITDSFGGDFSDDPERNLSAEGGGDILRIKVISDATKIQAQKYTSGQATLLESQYDERLPPYPEFLTNQTGCDERFLPQRRSHAQGMFYLIHADERFNYGLCAEELVRYRAGFGIFYCEPEKKIFQIEYFVGKDRPVSDVERFMNSFKCTE